MEQLKGKILTGKILVKPIENEKKTASGIIIPDSAQEKPKTGVVVLIGKPKKNEPMEIVVGDTVTYNKYSGTALSIDGYSYLLMTQQDILFILN